jgi:hypothetical protein
VNAGNFVSEQFAEDIFLLAGLSALDGFLFPPCVFIGQHVLQELMDVAVDVRVHCLFRHVGVQSGLFSGVFVVTWVVIVLGLLWGVVGRRGVGILGRVHVVVLVHGVAHLHWHHAALHVVVHSVVRGAFPASLSVSLIQFLGVGQIVAL